MRVLVAASGHPIAAPTPAGLAAFRLFAELAKQADCETWFLGCQDGRLDLRSCFAQPFSDQEYIYSPETTDDFSFANRDSGFPFELASLVRELRPDVVHFQDLSKLGIEAIDIVRRAYPSARVVVTLRDYAAICAHLGQMVTRPDERPCSAAEPAACARCFPDREPSAFHVRKLYQRRFLDQVDHFIAPSDVRRKRHIEWGLAGERISILPDVGEAADDAAATGPRPSDGLLRVGLFGGVSSSGGLRLLIDAARLLAGNRNVAIEIHCDPGDAGADGRNGLADLVKGAGSVLRYVGPADRNGIGRHMRDIDAVIVPSVGPAGGPDPIDAALLNRRPVICPGIEECAERVRDGIDGYHFAAGDAVSLAQLLERLAALPHRLHDLNRTLRRPPAPAEAAARHVELYRHVCRVAR